MRYQNILSPIYFPDVTLRTVVSDFYYYTMVVAIEWTSTILLLFEVMVSRQITNVFSISATTVSCV